jgi:ATP-binding cassette, subfamily B, bacterial HlyB/CyaB
MEGSAFDTALQCFVAVARHHGVDLSADRIKHDYALKPGDDITRLLPNIARSCGIRMRKLQVCWKDLPRLGGGLSGDRAAGQRQQRRPARLWTRWD